MRREIIVTPENIGRIKRAEERQRKREQKCVSCGRFVSYETAKVVDFTPDTDFTSERVAFQCAKCVAQGEGS